MSKKDEDLTAELMKKFDELFGALEDNETEINSDLSDPERDLLDLDDDLDDLENVVVLNDDKGKEVRFEFLDLIEYRGEEYIVLLPSDESEDSEDVVILKVDDIGSDDEESYSSVEDERTLNAVFEIFKEKFRDEFNFVD